MPDDDAADAAAVDLHPGAAQGADAIPGSGAGPGAGGAVVLAVARARGVVMAVRRGHDREIVVGPGRPAGARFGTVALAEPVGCALGVWINALETQR